MRKGSDSFKAEISRRRKKFAALLIGIAVGMMPTVTVMAATVSLTDGGNPKLPNNTYIYSGDTIKWDMGAGSGGLLVRYYDPEGNDLNVCDYQINDNNSGPHHIPNSEFSIDIGDAGISDIDFWIPTVEGLQFNYADGSLQGGETTWSVGNPKQDAVVKLVAVKKHKVTFDPNGAPGQPVVKETSNRKVSSFPEFTYEGYTFEGFFTKAEGGDEVTESTEFSQDTTVYAHWKKGKEKEKEKKKSGSSSSESHEVKPVVFNPYALNAHYYVNNVIDYKAILGRVEQGPAATAAFKAALPKGWNMAFSFSMSYDGKNEYSLKNGVIKLYVPADFQRAGRQYAIMALDKNGAVKVIYDADKIAQLVTASPNVEGYAYELIYKD